MRDLLMNNRSLLLHTDGRALRRVCLELLKDTEWGSFFADIETVRRANSPRAMQRRAKAFANLAQYINTASVERVALEAYGLHLNGTWNDGEHGVLYGIIKARCENTEWQGLLEILEQQETKQQKVEAYAAFIKLNL